MDVVRAELQHGVPLLPHLRPRNKIAICLLITGKQTLNLRCPLYEKTGQQMDAPQAWRED